MSQPFLPDRWSELAPLLDAALDTEPSEQPAFLDRACAGDARLRDEVEALLAECARTDRLLAAGVVERFGALLAEPPRQLREVLAGRYRVQREIGAGGMATVYLARDIKHDRDVALKVLRADLSAAIGTDRFLTEVQIAARLDHPHILTLIDSGSADGTLFYVMPYVRGESLRARLARERQLSLHDALSIARQIASALDYAHAQGVVHRDIKPENILLHEGEAVLADFGIALAVAEAGGTRLTQTGLSLGTPQYMSPEQATGERTLDARADIYSLGAVLYEMLAGEPPVTGATKQAIILKIITERAAAVTKHRPSVPEHVAAAVATSLEKLPADRFASAKAFADALDNTAYTHASGTDALHSASTSAHGVSKRLFTAVSILAAALLVTAVWGWRAALRETTGTAVRFPMALPPDVRLVAGVMMSPIALSPDGRDVVFAGVRASSSQMLFRRTIDDPTPHEIPGTEGAFAPFFSFDGKWVCFSAAGQLRKVQLSGGAVVPVADGGIPRGATWTRGDRVVLGAVGGQLASVPAVGGAPKLAAALDTAHGEVAQRYPLALENGETVLYLSYRGSANTARIGVASLESGSVRLLDLPPSGAPLAVLDGKLIYAGVSGSLMAVPFDSRTARVTGVPVPVIDGVASNANGVTNVAISRSGSLVMAPASQGQLVLSDMTGNAQVLFLEAKTFTHPRFSPDGKRVAVAVLTNTSTDIWIYDIATGMHGKLTSDGDNVRPEWTPDGKRVLYTSSRSDPTLLGLWWQPADFSGTAELLQRHPTGKMDGALISPDGHWLVYSLVEARGGHDDIWFRRLDGDTTSRPLATTKFAEQVPAISPDGRWVAYASNQSGLVEVYFQPFPGLGPRYPVSAGGGQTPRWAPDSRHIYYVAKGRLNVATLSTSPRVAVTSKPLFEGSYDFPISGQTNYDVAPDGKHMLLVKPVVSNAPIVMVRDWKYELRERIAQAKKR